MDPKEFRNIVSSILFTREEIKRFSDLGLIITGIDAANITTVSFNCVRDGYVMFSFQIYYHIDTKMWQIEGYENSIRSNKDKIQLIENVMRWAEDSGVLT